VRQERFLSKHSGEGITKNPGKTCPYAMNMKTSNGPEPADKTSAADKKKRKGM
jgi:hypothetical protein